MYIDLFAMGAESLGIANGDNAEVEIEEADKDISNDETPQTEEIEECITSDAAVGEEESVVVSESQEEIDNPQQEEGVPSYTTEMRAVFVEKVMSDDEEERVDDTKTQLDDEIENEEEEIAGGTILQEIFGCSASEEEIDDNSHIGSDDEDETNEINYVSSVEELKDELTTEQEEKFSEFLNLEKNKKQIIDALKNMDFACVHGNVLVSSETDGKAVELAKKFASELRKSNSNFSGKVALVNGTEFNYKKVDEVIDKLVNGVLIIKNANDMSGYIINDMVRKLSSDEVQVVVILTATKYEMEKLLSKHPKISMVFSTNVCIEDVNDRFLVEYGVEYAYKNEYSIDELGVLALHTLITNMQHGNDEFGKKEVEDIINHAIKRVNRRNTKHLMDVVFGKRYDSEDMIVLREIDFNTSK